MTEEARYAAAWQDRRRRMVTLRTVQLLLFPLVLSIALMQSRVLPALHVSVGEAFVCAFLVWFIAYYAVGIWLNRFRGPRCGKLYYWRLELKGYMDRQRKWRDCRHCGLQQDALPGNHC
jgi:hypothetical protein